MTLGSSSMPNKTICWLTGQKQSDWRRLGGFAELGGQILAGCLADVGPHFFMSRTWEENADHICRLHNMFSISIIRIVNKVAIKLPKHAHFMLTGLQEIRLICQVGGPWLQA